MPKTNVRVKLVGEDGNAFFIMGRVITALKRAGHDDLAVEYRKEATSGDYDNLLRVTMDYVDCDSSEEELEPGQEESEPEDEESRDRFYREWDNDWRPLVLELSVVMQDRPSPEWDGPFHDVRTMIQAHLLVPVSWERREKALIFEFCEKYLERFQD